MDKKKVLIGIVIIVLIIIVSLIIKNNISDFYEDDVRIYELNYIAEYSNDGKVGVVDKNGKEIITPEYADIYILNSEKDVFVAILDDGSSKIINKDNKEIFKEYEDVSALKTSYGEFDFEKEVLRFKKDDKYGLINFDGEIVVPASYDYIESLKSKPGKLLVKKDNNYGVVNDDGKLVIKVEYDSIVGDGFITDEEKYTKTGYIVKKKTDSGDLYGYISASGKKILKPEFESVDRILNFNDIENVYLICMTNGKKGVYKNDNQIIGLDYQSVQYSNNSNIFVAKTTQNYYFYNVNGRKILDSKYKEYSLAGNYISVLEDDERKLYDINGNFISKMNFKSIQETKNSNYIITIDDEDHYSIMNKSTVIDNEYINLQYIYDDYFIFTNNENKMGVLDVWKGIVIEPKYDSIYKLDNIDAIGAISDSNTTFYSKKLNMISTISDAIVESVDDKFSVIYSNNEMIYLNQMGEEAKNTEIFDDNKFYSFCENGKWGFKDKNGNVIIDCKYDMVTELNEYGFAGIKKDGKWGVVNSNAEIILDTNYEVDTFYLPSFIGKSYLELTETLHCIKLD